MRKDATAREIHFDDFKSTPMIGEIGLMLVKHYGFTDEELDFIPLAGLGAAISYDIKDCMGQDAGHDEE